MWSHGVACQALLSMRFHRQEYWSGCRILSSFPLFLYFYMLSLSPLCTTKGSGTPHVILCHPLLLLKGWRQKEKGVQRMGWLDSITDSMQTQGSPSPGDLPKQATELRFPALSGEFFTAESRPIMYGSSQKRNSFYYPIVSHILSVSLPHSLRQRH